MRAYIRSLAALSTLVVVLGVHPALAADLFEPVRPDDVAAPKFATRAAAAVARQRFVRVNDGAFEPATDADAAGGAAEAAPSPTLRIELFPDTAATFARDSLDPAFDGGSIWTGTDRSGGGVATLVVRNGAVTGQVEVAGRTYRIAPVSGQVHSVSEIALARLPKDGPHVYPPTVVRSKRKAPMAQAPGGTTVDVLFAFTANAGAASPDIRSEINLAVALANQAYRASRISITMRLRGVIAVGSYNESSVGYSTTLNNITGFSGSGSTPAGRAAFNRVRASRNTVKADLVVLIREGGEFCGQGWVIPDPDGSTADYGYSQVSRDCISDYTVAHETGHNMGLNHDRYVEPAAPASKYNYGYVDLVSKAEDIMSYSDRCFAAGIGCTRLNRYANPRTQVRGRPFGIVQGRPGAADGARSLNENRSGVASYR